RWRCFSERPQAKIQYPHIFGHMNDLRRDSIARATKMLRSSGAYLSRSDLVRVELQGKFGGLAPAEIRIVPVFEDPRLKTDVPLVHRTVPITTGGAARGVGGSSSRSGRGGRRGGRGGGSWRGRLRGQRGGARIRGGGSRG